MSTPTGAEVTASHATKTYPLNSRCLTAKTLSRITKALGLLTGASPAETMQLIEGQLGEEHEPRNVQVDLTVVSLESSYVARMESSPTSQRRIGKEWTPSRSDGEPERDGDGAGERNLEAEAEEEDVGGTCDCDWSQEELAAQVGDVEAALKSERDRTRGLEAELERVREARQCLEDQLMVR